MTGTVLCGIFGVILQGRKKIDIGVMRALTLANRQRGNQSLGFFNSNFDVYKAGDDPIDVLQTQECADFMAGSRRDDNWFMVGHTRFSTRGAVNDKNSHPFTYGDCVGAHNGVIEAPYEYDVDSEFIIDMMDQHDNDIQTALKDEWGYWTASWYNRRDNHLYLSMYDNVCGLVEHEGAWYFSSDAEHLAACLGAREIRSFKNGETCRFDSKGKLEWLPTFESGLSYSYKHDIRTAGGAGSGYTGYYGSGNAGNAGTAKNVPTAGSSKSGGWPDDQGLFPQTDGDEDKWGNVADPEQFIQDYDEEFRAIWEQYEHQYEDIG